MNLFYCVLVSASKMKTDKLWIRVLINIQIFSSFNYEAMVVILGKVILCSVTLTKILIAKFLFCLLAYPEQHSGYSINILRAGFHAT